MSIIENRRIEIRSMKKLIGLGILAVVVVVSLFGSVTIVSAGNRGIVLRFGKIDRVLPEGLNFKIPFAERVETMDVTIQKVQTLESTASYDLQEVMTTIAVNYRVLPDSAGELYRELRHELEDRVIKPNIEESIGKAQALERRLPAERRDLRCATASADPAPGPQARAASARAARASGRLRSTAGWSRSASRT